jgi:hypothetical protein
MAEKALTAVIQEDGADQAGDCGFPGNHPPRARGSDRHAARRGRLTNTGRTLPESAITPLYTTSRGTTNISAMRMEQPPLTARVIIVCRTR